MLTRNTRNIWCFWKSRYFWKMPLSRQIIREANVNYFETGKLVYPGAWRALFWSQDVTVSMYIEMFLACLFDVINCYLFILKRNKISRSLPWNFMVVGFGYVLSPFTNSLLILVSLTPFFHDLKIPNTYSSFSLKLC